LGGVFLRAAANQSNLAAEPFVLEEPMAKLRHCEICKVAIDPERAEAQPQTRLCNQHGEEIRKYGGEFTTTLAQSTLQKPGSIKNNPGDVVVADRVRNYDGINKLRDNYELNRK
jgi:hypothetical protein